MKTTAENRCAGEGKGREKIAEASARLVSQYGVKPGGGETRADSRAVWKNGSVAYEFIHVHEGNLFWLCGAGKRVVLSVVHKQQIYLVK
jgi:hypothetical protein